MKTEELRRLYIEEKYLKPWTMAHKFRWKWNDNSIDIIGNLYIPCHWSFDKLPFKIGRISGWFDCSHTGLKTLENFPDYVGEHLTRPKNFTEAEIRKICKIKNNVI